MTGFIIGLAVGAVALYAAVSLPIYRAMRVAGRTRGSAALAAVREAWELL